MILKQQFARMILGAAAILAALTLASSVASAHAGHAHPQAAVSATHEPIAPATQVLQVEVTAAPALPSMPSGDAHCDGGGCCSNGPCTGCTGFLQVMLPSTMLPLSSSSLVIAEAAPRASPLDGRLRRPPKSFV